MLAQVSKLAAKLRCARDLKLCAGPAQELYSLLSVPIVFVQSQDCPQTRFTAQNLPHPSAHPVGFFASYIGATIPQRESSATSEITAAAVAAQSLALMTSIIAAIINPAQRRTARCGHACDELSCRA